MKVIAKASESKYLCEVSHDELEKFMGKYYGKLEKLNVGQELHLGLGYDFATRIEHACKQMRESMKAFDEAKKVMTSYAVAIANNRTEGGAE